MAGSFGYEADKYDVSIACGEHALLPRVRKTGLRSIIVADGFSCKVQIAQETPRHGLHLAEVIQMALRHGKHGPPGIYPEEELVKPRQQAVKRSMLRAGIAAGAMLAAAIGFVVWRKRR
jgi:hypothetical protein